MSTPAKIERLDRQFEALLLDAQFAAEETELTPQKRKARRMVAERDPLAFCKTYYPGIFDTEFSALHRHIARLEAGHHLISGFPQSGKSACTYVVHAIRPIALGLGGLVNVSLRTQDKAKMRTASLSRIIQRNSLLVYDYEIEALQDTAGFHIFKSSGGQTHLVATSSQMGLRSYVDDNFKRFRRSIADDLYDRDSVRSELDNHRIKEFVEGEIWRQMETDGISIMLGNMIKDTCPMGLLRKEHPEKYFSFPIRDASGNPNWAARHTQADIKELEEGTTFDVWHGEYLDDPLERGEIFDPDWLRFTPVRQGEIVASITAIDPSFGTSPSACWKSAFTLGIYADGSTQCLDLYLRKEGYPLFFDYLFALRARVPNHKILLFENDFAQFEHAKPYYRIWMQQTGHTLTFQLFSAKQLATEHFSADKEGRILNLVHPHQTGTMTYSTDVEGTRDFKEYKRQFLCFGKHGKKKLDGLDSGATAHIMIRRYVEQGHFKQTKKRAFARPNWIKGGWR